MLRSPQLDEREAHSINPTSRCCCSANHQSPTRERIKTVISTGSEVTSEEFWQPVDWEHLHQLSDNNPEFEQELLEVFVADSYTVLVLLKQSIAVQDARQLEQSAHHIKGASANVGAIAIYSVAVQLEQQARAQQFEDSDRLIQQLETAIGQIQTLIQSGS
jgi:HPt (histidine-containing phosphotransfer) domain-containing protein